mgnify:CR=1 FL=1
MAVDINECLRDITWSVSPHARVWLNINIRWYYIFFCLYKFVYFPPFKVSNPFLQKKKERIRIRTQWITDATMEQRFDGNSKYVAHAWKKEGLFGLKISDLWLLSI